MKHLVSYAMSPMGTLWVDTYNAFRSHSVSTAREAQRLGEYAAHKLYDGHFDFNSFPVVRVDDNGNEWHIWFSHAPIPPVDMGNGLVHCTFYLSGGPEIHIDKATGRITSWGLYK